MIANKEKDTETDIFIYDLDAPNLPKNAVPSDDPNDPNDEHFFRRRDNFVQWSTYDDDDKKQVKCSSDYNWYWRASWHRKKDGKIEAKGAVGDNEVKKNATTLLTYDLNASTAPDFNVASFAPNTATNRDTAFSLTVNGSFPAGTGPCSVWIVQMISSPADHTGDTGSGSDDDVLFANSVVRVADGSKLTASFNLKPALLLPAPAKSDYKIRVIKVDKMKEAPDTFSINENALDKWTITPGPQRKVGEDLEVAAISFDNASNVVTRPGNPRPTISKSSGTATIGPITVYGRYGVFTTKIPLTGPGTLVLKVEGGGKVSESIQLTITNP